MNDTDLEKAKQHLRKGDFNAARSEFNKILDRNPHDIAGLHGLSYALGHLGLLDEALEVAQTALSVEPDNPEVHSGISWVYYKMRELHKAREHACKAISLAPDVGRYHYGMVPVALALKEMDMALKYIETAHRLDRSIFDKNAYIALWGLRIVVGYAKLCGLIAWGIVATYVLLFELGHSRFLLKLLLVGLPFVGTGIYYLVQHRYRRAFGAFILGLLWGGVTYAVAQWFFLK